MEEVLQKLTALKIKYKLVNHGPVYTIDDMKALDPEMFKTAEICKNLFLRDQKGKRHFLVVMLGDKKVEMTKIQSQAKATKLSFASPQRLEKYLKLEAGHVSPMGLINDQEHAIEVLLDEDLKSQKLIAVHPNNNEQSILISPVDLIKFIEEMDNTYKFIKI